MMRWELYFNYYYSKSCLFVELPTSLDGSSADSALQSPCQNALDEARQIPRDTIYEPGKDY